MLILKVNNKQIPDGSFIKLDKLSSVSIKNNPPRSIQFSTSDPRDYVEWYSDFIRSKQLAILKSGKSEFYEFHTPYVAKHIRSINGTLPDTLGNITLLGSAITDVSTDPGTPVIQISRLKSQDRLEQLKEIYLFTMRLYAANNHLTSRLLEFSPGTWNTEDLNNKLGKLRGSLINYQANVARWNFLVWKKSYTQDIEVSRQNIALSLGFSCVVCRIAGAEIETVIRKVSAQPTSLSTVDSAHCLTIYRQSIADDRRNKKGNVITEITKKFSDSDDGTEPNVLYGFGMDGKYENWDTITIKQTLPEMEQSDKYAELFSLAVGMGVSHYISLPKESDPNASMNEFEITTTWKITPVSESGAPGDVVTMKKSEIVQVAAVNATEVETEDSDEEEED